MARIDIKSNGTGGGGGSGTVTSVSIATGTSGTNVNATGTVTTAGTLTVNIPTASAVNTGKLSNTDWSTFNNKQTALVSGTNIKTVNSTTLLGSGNLAVQDVLVSGTNIKTVNGLTILGSGDLSTGNLNGGILQNFIPNLAGTSVNLTLDSSNTATWNANVIGVTGTVTITLNASLPNGFSITVLQLTSGTCTIAGSGGLVIGNRQSHTGNNGQYSVISIIKYTNVLAILGGDTA